MVGSSSLHVPARTNYTEVLWRAMILEMMRWRVPAALMAACLMLQFNSKVPDSENVDFVELFSGDAAVSAHLRAMGLSGSSHDLDYGAHYDLTQTSGFLLRGMCMF